MRPSDLTGEARRLYEVWRDAGYSEAQALEEVERSGIVFEQQMIELYEARGLSPEAARHAARGRYGRPTGHPFNQLVEAFQAAGLSPEAARYAAIGRNGGTEMQARSRTGKALQESAATLSASLAFEVGDEGAQLGDGGGLDKVCVQGHRDPAFLICGTT